MSNVSKDDLTGLRAVIREECSRRNGFGSLAGYADETAYGVGNTPESGSPITASQGKGIIDPLIAVRDYNALRELVIQGRPIPPDFDTSTIITYVNDLRNEPLDSATTSCRSACTGLCISYCSNACRNGCTSNCSSTCAGDCSGYCASGCTGGCSNSCTGGCSNSCTGNCANSCSGTCHNTTS